MTFRVSQDMTFRASQDMIFRIAQIRFLEWYRV